MFNKEGMNQIVSAAVIAALGDQAVPMLESMVKKSIETKVDSNGREGYGNMTLLEFFAKRHLDSVIDQAVGEWIKNNTKKIQQQINDKLVEGAIGRGVIDLLETQISQGYLRVNLTLEK